MSNIADTLGAIKLTNNLYNTQISSLLKTVQDDIDQLILKTQSDLITKISQDYNISIRELNRKYILKPKKIRKTKDISDDSPTMQTINDSKNYQDLSDDESNISNIMVRNTSTNISIQDIISSKTDQNMNDNTNNTNNTSNTSNNISISTSNDTSEVIENPDVLFKTITIKNMDYLLNISTNEIFDMENNLIGQKRNNKYLMKK